ncbi:MAG: hypothetical protein MI924_25285 [Chloroflexales bacterium]|nr:hypothetical protein [Chloroflexales bacterium]
MSMRFRGQSFAPARAQDAQLPKASSIMLTILIVFAIMSISIVALGQLPSPLLPAPYSGPVYRDIKGSDEAQLNGYGWVDQANGVVHIPIEAAMDLIIERDEIPVRPEAPQAAP